MATIDGKVKETLAEMMRCCSEARAAADRLEGIIVNLEDAPEDLTESGFQCALDIQSAGSNVIERLGRIDGFYAASFELKHGSKSEGF